MSALSPEQWEELSPYLDEGLALPAEERTAWLASLRARNPALAGRLESLLEEHRALSQEGFMERRRASLPATTALAGQPIGAYRLVSPIGEGGMGSVWLAAIWTWPRGSGKDTCAWQEFRGFRRTSTWARRRKPKPASKGGWAGGSSAGEFILRASPAAPTRRSQTTH